ncbi:relaxase/mobilization nuclease domain-containing protein [Hyphomicrobium sp.]|uniref:relaxase/mobilization nuclease domain-containing protein n=1 Tax=Hyphomicrobium sp. TaxID=82 RepID=UPI001DB99860|nr:relaxase/mobilization nuclease domain-containing protein [Hyphomicrobium sp.]MBY0560602.1 relaxase/mobilization nuclease domain-containing protein [Hyphomicrobium sp.]
MSFKGACGYILHDAQKTSRDRVLWSETQNLISKADDAWFEMYATARDQAQLKQHSGQSASGRKNTKPVLHLTLSWAIGEEPTPEHMRETARSCLNVLGLGEHQALLAAHCDKEHMHVHMVVNTVHPETGLTAQLKYSKERLSRWAEAYEREHGIHCEERIKNNERRKEVAAAREQDASIPYVPVKNEQTPRKQWFERREIDQRVQDLRDAIAKEYQTRGDGLWWQQQQAWKAAMQQSKEKDRTIRADIKAKYKHKWRNLHHQQRKEARYVERISGSIFERAVYVFSNRRNLGSFDKPLTRRQMLSLITSGDRLKKRIAAIHLRDRQGLARQSKLEAKSLTEPLWSVHKQNLDTMKARQTAERRSLRREGWAAAKEVRYEAAKQSLTAEQNNGPREFQMPGNEARPAHQFHRSSGAQEIQQSDEAEVSRAEQIKRDMQAWRRQQRGHDQGREL